MPHEMTLVVLSFVTVVTGVVFVTYVVCVIRSVLALKWTPVEAHVVHLDVRESEGDTEKASIYTPVLTYKYCVNGATYISEKIGFGIWGNNMLWLVERTLAKACIHPFYAFYNPRNPGEAVAVRGITLHHVAGLAVLGSTFGIALQILSLKL
jgi:hypothetical protein